jgi:hypothetical protein
MAWAQHSAQPPAPADLITHVRTAGDLAAVCTPAWHGVPRLEAIAYCQGFLTGVGQYHAALHTVGGSLRPLYCVPSPGPTIAESGVAYAAWLQSNPAHRGESAVDGLLRWAQATFPCPQQMPARTRHPAR